MTHLKSLQVVVFLSAFIFSLASCALGDGDNKKLSGNISMENYADSIFQIIKAHRTSYAKLIINRLVNDEQVIQASEQWQEDKALLLPAQMFRETATILQKSGNFLKK